MERQRQGIPDMPEIYPQVPSASRIMFCVFCRLRSSSKLGASVGFGLQPCSSIWKPFDTGVANGASNANAEIKETHNENAINLFVAKVMVSKKSYERCRGRARLRQKWQIPYLMNACESIGPAEGSNTCHTSSQGQPASLDGGTIK
jgi:hypothetical protein